MVVSDSGGISTTERKKERKDAKAATSL